MLPEEIANALINSNFIWLIPVIIILAIWELIWKGLGLWRAGRNNQLAWFICILIFNTIGILPIVYLLITNKKSSKKK